MAQYNGINAYQNLKRIEYDLLKFNFKFPHNINFVVLFTNIQNEILEQQIRIAKAEGAQRSEEIIKSKITEQCSKTKK